MDGPHSLFVRLFQGMKPTQHTFYALGFGEPKAGGGKVLVYAHAMSLECGGDCGLHGVVVLHENSKQIHHHQLRRFKTANHCIVRHGAKHRTEQQSSDHQNVQIC